MQEIGCLPFIKKNSENFGWEFLVGKNGTCRTTFSEFPLVRGIFQWDEPKKRLPFTSQPEFPGICGKW